MTAADAIRAIPYVCGLPDTRREHHRAAAGDWVLSVLFSALPILLAAFAGILVDPSGPNFGELVVANVSRGELFLYSSAMLAPIIVFVSRDYDATVVLPSKLSFIVAIILILCVSVVVFSVDRAGMARWVQDEQGDKPLLLWVSFGLYVFTVGLNYLALVYRSVLDTISATDFREADSKYAEALGEAMRK